MRNESKITKIEKILKQTRGVIFGYTNLPFASEIHVKLLYVK